MASNAATDLAIEPKETLPNVDMIAKDDIGKNEKSLAEKDEALVETGSVDEPVKSYYSKVSVWLMILFSGLAIGSDG